MIEQGTIEQWVPTIVSIAALGLVFWGIRTQRAEMIKKVDKIEEDYLQKDDHDNLDKIQYLTIKELITDKISELKDAIFPEIRAIKDRLPRNAKDNE